jgi:hypothetical protein
MIVTPTDDSIRKVLTEAKVIAVVGHSNRVDRPSYQIAQFLRQRGYRLYPVNPAVQEIDGQPSYPDLQSVPEPIDIVNVFRRSEYLAEVVAESIAVQAKTIWAQLGIADPIAAETARKAGLTVIMDACIKVEYLRLHL